MGNVIRGLVFQPPPTSYDSYSLANLIFLKTVAAGAAPDDDEEVADADKGKVAAIYHSVPRALCTILYSHGNAEDIGMLWPWLTKFAERVNCNILAYDYEGYGMSTSSTTNSNSSKAAAANLPVPNDQACYRDIDAAYKYLTNVLACDPRTIIIFGRSLGSGPSTYLAERLCKEGIPIGGLVLQSPLLSVFRVAFDFRFTFLGDFFSNIDRIPNIDCPVYVIHGTADEVVPFWNGEQLFFTVQDKWRAKPLWIKGGGHNDLENYGDAGGGRYYEQRFRTFITEWILSRL